MPDSGDLEFLEVAEHLDRGLLCLPLHFAEKDDRINTSWPPYEAALKAAHVKYQAFVYPGTEHGFNNDTTPRYDASAAKLAWQRTMALFDRTLRK